jgi:hypothetical protein
MRFFEGIGIAFFASIVLAHIQPATQSQAKQATSIEARLTLLTATLREGDQYKVRVEIENVSDRLILVGRDLNGINNWPFRIEIQLEDTAGHQYGTGEAAYIDGPPIATFSTEDGILKWWMPLPPHTFMGIYTTASLSGVPPGKYRLHGRYVSFLSAAQREAPEGASIRIKYPVFEGQVETNSIWIEVLPRQ